MAKRGAGLAWLPQRLVQDDLTLGRLLVAGDRNMRVGFDIALYRLRGNTNARVNAIWQGLSSDARADT
jgi:DNA-binding transcriptional LysR family regulator